VARRVLGRSVSADINVTPMADIMLVLLIIFMITIPNMQSGVTITLPKSVNSVEAHNVDSPKSVVVALSRDLEIYIGKKPVAPPGKTTGLKPEEQWAVRQQELSEQLKQRFQSSTEIDKSIFLKADTSVPYGRVVQVVNNCRSSGVDRIGLMTEKEEEKK
jgi:biopolymer transport protein TolR